MTEPLPTREDIERLATLVDIERDRASMHFDVTAPLSVKEAYERLLAAYENLSVAEEELRAQHDAIVDAQAELEVERHRYRTLFEFAPDPYIVTDAAGTIEEANTAAAEFLGVPVAMLIGRAFVSFVDMRARPEFRSHLHGLSRVARSDKLLVELTVREGRAVPVETTVATIQSHRGQPRYCWLLRDMSSHRDSEESMLALNRSLNARVAQRTRELEIALANEQAARK